jgi:hypothetical protein
LRPAEGVYDVGGQPSKYLKLEDSSESEVGGQEREYLKLNTSQMEYLKLEASRGNI